MSISNFHAISAICPTCRSTQTLMPARIASGKLTVECQRCGSFCGADEVDKAELEINERVYRCFEKATRRPTATIEKVNGRMVAGVQPRNICWCVRDHEGEVIATGAEVSIASAYKQIAKHNARTAIPQF